MKKKHGRTKIDRDLNIFLTKKNKVNINTMNNLAYINNMNNMNNQNLNYQMMMNYLMIQNQLLIQQQQNINTFSQNILNNNFIDSPQNENESEEKFYCINEENNTNMRDKEENRNDGRNERKKSNIENKEEEKENIELFKKLLEALKGQKDNKKEKDEERQEDPRNKTKH